MKKIKLTKEEMNRLGINNNDVEFDRFMFEDELHPDNRNKGQKHLNNIYQNGEYVGAWLNVVRIGKLVFVLCVLLILLTTVIYFTS